MGHRYSLPHLWKDDEPYCFDPIMYDPKFGFGDDRKLKVIRATKEEMDSANLEPNVRDLCAHATINFRGCVTANQPFWYKCKGLWEEVDQCYIQERVHDMKEFEREKRLNRRERRLREAAAKG